MDSIRVSILDDHCVLRESLTDVLQSAGMTVVASYGDGEEFLSRIRGDQPRVAIVDLKLDRSDGPQSVDGFDVVREIRECHPEVSTLVLTAIRDRTALDRCYQLGAAGYLEKLSAGKDELVRAVNALARGERIFPVPALETASPPSPKHGLLSRLSLREREVLAYVAGGADNLKIAAHLKITERTVKAHVSSLYRKLGPENRAQLALLARQLGVRPPLHV